MEVYLMFERHHDGNNNNHDYSSGVAGGLQPGLLQARHGPVLGLSRPGLGLGWHGLSLSLHLSVSHRHRPQEETGSKVL